MEYKGFFSQKLVHLKVRLIYLRDRKSIIDGACGPAVCFTCLHDFIGFFPYEWLFFHVFERAGVGKTIGEVEEKEKIIEKNT